MVYLVCFVFSVIFLMFILSYGRTVNLYFVMLSIIIAIGNGGFFALAEAGGLGEAVLANKLCYVIGIFAPITVFHIVCSICRIRISSVISFALYLVQIAIYLSVCTIGKNGLFYKTVEFHAGNPGYLTKTYGPMHMGYIVTMILYTLAGLIFGLISLERKTVVSKFNVLLLVFVNAFLVGVYLIERITKVNFELMPVAYVVGLFVLLIPLIRVYEYSIYDNRNIFTDKIKSTGYILFDRKLKYMGSSDHALVLFPELKEWELEKKIPGSGGRFNTFLRQPLLAYTKDPSDVAMGGYEYKNEVYRYEISKLFSSGKNFKGYIIQVLCITDAVKGEN